MLDSKTDSDSIDSLTEFGRTGDIREVEETALSQCVAIGYAKGKTTFSKMMDEGEKLLPTQNAFKQNLLRALVQTPAWQHANIAIVDNLVGV